MTSSCHIYLVCCYRGCHLGRAEHMHSLLYIYRISQYHRLMGNCQTGVYPPPRIFQSNGEVRKTRRREVPARAPTCLKLYLDPLWQDTRSPCKARTPLHFSFKLLGLTASWRRRRVRKDPPLDYNSDGHAPAMY